MNTVNENSSADDPASKSSVSLDQSYTSRHSGEISHRYHGSSLARQTIYEDDDTFENAPKLSFIHRFVTNWLIMDPVLLSKYENREKKFNRNYKVARHRDISRFIYFLDGRLHTTKDKPINLLTLLLIVIPIVIYCIFEASWQWHNISPGIVIIFVYLWFITIMNFFKASTLDPGILPRNLHIPKSPQGNRIVDPPEEYFNTVTLPGYGNGNGTRAIRQHGVQVKYCQTCHIWRPARTSHCSKCQVCILNHDHHCVFLNNCVGERNYIYFLWFLLLVCICCWYLIIVSIVQLCYYRIGKVDEINNWYESIRHFPLSLFLTIYTILAMIYPILLVIFHIFLTSQNLTTREYLNHIYKRRNADFVNVFDTHSVLKNLYINWIGKSTGTDLVRIRDKYRSGDIRFEAIEPLLYDTIEQSEIVEQH